MGRKCCVPECSSNYDAVLRQGQSSISTFKFPENADLRQHWIRAVKRKEDWTPGRTASICINHFQPEDIVRYEKPAKLKPEAIPVIFGKTLENRPVVKRGRPRKTKNDVNHSEIECSKLRIESLDADDQNGNDEADEIIVPADDLMEELILDFDGFSRCVEDKINLGRWHYYRNENVMHFYSLDDEDKDIAIRVENSIKVFDDFRIAVFIKDVKQADEALRWILGQEMKICRWSQIDTILQKYDSKVHKVRETADSKEHSINDSVLENDGIEAAESGSQEEEQQLDFQEEVEFLALESDNEGCNSPSLLKEPKRNPLKTNRERVISQKDRTERKSVKETVQALKKSKHKCFICSQEHELNEELERHLPVHVAMLPYECERCVSRKVIITTLASLNRHFLMHFKPLKCRLCDVRFSSYGTRLLHEQNSHENSGPISCEICGKISHSQRGYQHHVKIHTNPDAMKCQLCAKQLSSGYELKLHMRVHTKEKPNKCPFCPAAFNRVSNLVVHKRRFHCKELPFICSECGEGFRSNAELKRHSVGHNPDEPPNEASDKMARKSEPFSTSRGTKDYHCQICDIPILTASSYHSHMRKHRKRYQCSYCGLRVGQLRDFIDHENTHTGERPYECKICSKKFKTSSTYYGHRAVHAAEKRFSCDDCGRRFTRHRHLVLHAKTHSETTHSKLHSCSVCGKGFASQSSFRRHVESHAVIGDQYPVENKLSSAHSSEAQIEQSHGAHILQVPNQMIITEVPQTVGVALATSATEQLQFPQIIQTVDGREAIVVTADMISSQNFIIVQQPADEA